MPELPDIQIYAKNIKKIFDGCAVLDLEACSLRQINVTQNVVADAIIGSTLSDVYRHGKEIYLCFTSGFTLSFHLMLKGYITVTDDILTINDKIFWMIFDNNKYLIISDSMKRANLHLNPSVCKTPDALDDILTHEYISEKLKEYGNNNIKSFLIDQDIIRGIGNAYADEILWESRISPESICNRIPDTIIDNLIEKIKMVLNEAIAYLNETTPDAISGEARGFLKIHNKEKKTSPSGSPIIIKKVGNKTTYFTNEQVDYR